jgi:hypothetical protein
MLGQKPNMPWMTVIRYSTTVIHGLLDHTHPVFDAKTARLFFSLAFTFWVLSLRELYLKPSLIYAELTFKSFFDS